MVMRKQLLQLICSMILLSFTVSGEKPTCQKTDRHCFDFQEQDVESTFDGVGEVATRTLPFIHSHVYLFLS